MAQPRLLVASNCATCPRGTVSRQRVSPAMHGSPVRGDCRRPGRGGRRDLASARHRMPSSRRRSGDRHCGDGDSNRPECLGWEDRRLPHCGGRNFRRRRMVLGGGARMTPGRIVYSGTDAPTRPGTRSGFARSVSGVCPEASRRPAGIPVTIAPSAVLTRMIASDVSPAKLAGRSSCGCPAPFPFHSAAASGNACAEGRPPPSDPFRAVGGRRPLLRASAYSPWVHVGRQGHHARAGLGRPQFPAVGTPPEAREADVLHLHAPSISALRPPRQELRRCASESRLAAPSVFVVTNTVGEGRGTPDHPPEDNHDRRRVR